MIKGGRTKKTPDEVDRLHEIIIRIGKPGFTKRGRLALGEKFKDATNLEKQEALLEKARTVFPESKIEEILKEYGVPRVYEAVSVVDIKRQIVRAKDAHGELVLASPNPFAQEGVYFISQADAIPPSKPVEAKEPVWEVSARRREQEIGQAPQTDGQVSQTHQPEAVQPGDAPNPVVPASAHSTRVMLDEVPIPPAPVQSTSHTSSEEGEAAIDYAALAQQTTESQTNSPLRVSPPPAPVAIQTPEPRLAAAKEAAMVHVIEMPEQETVYKVPARTEANNRPEKRRTIAQALMELGFGNVQAEEMIDPKLDQNLLRKGRITLEEAAQAQALSRNLTYVDVTLDPPNPSVTHLLDENTCRSERVFPYDMQDGTFVVLTDMPAREAVIRTKVVERSGQRQVSVRITSPPLLDKLIREQYTSATALQELHEELEASSAAIPEVSLGSNENAVNRFVTEIILDAAQRGASDIHFEPMKDGLQVRLRIDGRLRPAMKESIATSGMANVVRVVKLMARMDVGNNRTPQDNRISLKVGDRRLNMRVNSMPQTGGHEKIVLRILKDAGDIPDIDQLGMVPETLKRFKDIIRKPEGLFLVTGPTGSGKSFTLYSALKTAATPERNAQTLEDPIEYEIPGLNQSQVNAETGYTFAAGLRAAMRQDPDLLLLGEIRDGETANISLSMANTGHQVFSTLHTISASAAVQRLRDLGAQNYNISPSLQGVMAQRLVRKLCPHCSVPEPLPERVSRTLTKANVLFPDNQYRVPNPSGCPRCENGRKGRMPIHELLVVSPAIRELINTGASVSEIERVAVKEGMLSLMLDGYVKVASGQLAISDLESALNEIAAEEPALTSSEPTRMTI